VVEIHRRVRRGRPLCMHFPTTDGREPSWLDKPAMIAALSAELKDCSVFDAGALDGAARISVVQVISEADVLAHAEMLLEAAREFRRLATDLMQRLASKLGVPVTEFTDHDWEEITGPELSDQRGRLDDEWSYYFHGLECCFKSDRTGQWLDVLLHYESEFGVLDPWFFYHFLNTTPRYRKLARLFVERNDDPARALELLEAHGRLCRVSRALHGETGVVAC
jgi:hypothetical protein